MDSGNASQNGVKTQPTHVPVAANGEGVLSANEHKEMIDAIEDIDNTVKAWRQFSGMHTILKELEENKDRPFGVNDLTLAMSIGIDEASEQAVSGVLESAVVAALLLSFSLPLVVDPPDAISELPNNDWRKVMHLFGWGLMSILTIANVLYARIYTTAVARAVRCSDKLRIHMAGNAFNEGLMMVYATFFCLAVAAFPDVAVYYGVPLAFTLIIVCVGFCFGAVALSYKYIGAGHVEYGWRLNRTKRNDPVNDMILFETLYKRIRLANRLLESDKPFFEFSQKDSITQAQGISLEGKELFGFDKKEA